MAALIDFINRTQHESVYELMRSIIENFVSSFLRIPYFVWLIDDAFHERQQIILTCSVSSSSRLTESSHVS